MPNDWYQGRMPRTGEWTSREVRLSLTPAEWERFDQIAREAEWSRSKTASSLVSRQLRMFVLGLSSPKEPDDPQVLLRRGLEAVGR